MDLRKKRASPVAALHLKDGAGNLMYSEGPDGEPDLDKPVRAFVHGPASPVFIAQKRLLEREIMEAVKAAHKDKNAPAPEVLTPERRARFLCAVTDHFENIELTADDGSAVAEKDLPAAIYGDPGLGYIGEQVDVFSQSWAGFMTGSPKS